MLKEIIEKIKTKYWYMIVLVIYICILLLMAIYDTSKFCNEKMEVNIHSKSILTNDGVLNDKYLSKADILNCFSSHTFYDRISRKLIITSYDNILKIKDGDYIMINENDKLWYDIDEIAKHFGLKTFVDYKKNEKYLHKYEELYSSINSNRVEVYDIVTNKIISIVYENQKCNIIMDDDFFDDEKSYAKVVILENDGSKYVGNVKKENINYIKTEQIVDNNEQKEYIMVSVKNKLSEKTDLTVVNALAVDMLRINSINTLVEEKYSLNSDLKQDIYGIINNGYRLSSFDPNILSNIVNSDKNKEEIINQIIKYSEKNKLKGILVDFNGFKSSDKELVTEFIKELAVNLHMNKKYIIVKVRDSSTYDLETIDAYIDYVIVQAHSTRTTASKTSGSHSTVDYVKKTLFNVRSVIDAKKIILEIAPYSILWTERGGTVINAELYYMDTCEKYIKTNGLKKYYDKLAGQNAINYTKGVVTYKMWIEDTDSILSKVSLAHKMGISNFIIYRSGYETKEIYNEIYKVIY